MPWGRCEIEGLKVRIPSAARAAGAGDNHLTVVDQASGWEYDLWAVQDKPPGGGSLRFAWGGRTRIDGDGLGSGATAAGFGGLAGIIRAPELAAGRIEHALFLVAPCDSGRRVHPASGSGRPCSALGLPADDAPPMGARLQLDLSHAELAALDVPQWKRAILTAMAKYGMYLGDTGGETWGVQAESGLTYTSFGVEDQLAAFARWAGAPAWEDHYVLGLRDGVDWARRLRVVDPCVTAGTC
ncbi:MAG: hypothetical protein HZB46_11370 [Solirubrobacterales bacterium]|nr:hypothetical protein [Solirubrobacterales bacterium]